VIGGYLRKLPAALAATVVGLALLGTAAAVAGAETVTVGESTLASVGPALSSLSPEKAPVFQGDATSNYVLSSPQTGTVTSFSFMSAGAAPGTMYALAVLAPAEGGEWTLVSESAAVTVTSANGVDAANGPYPTSQPIAAGDRIGLEPIGGKSTPIEVTGIAGDGVRYFSTAFTKTGETQPLAPGSTTDPGQLLPLQATVSFTPVPTVAPPANVTLPRVSGTPKAGKTLTCQPGSWTNSPTYAFTWTQTTLSLIPGAKPPKVISSSVRVGDGQTYVVPDLPAGVAISCTVTATNAAPLPGAGVEATSLAVSIEASAPALAPSFSAVYHTTHNAPSISATVSARGTNVCHPGIWLHYPASFTYAWFEEQYSVRLHRFEPRLIHRGQDYDVGTGLVNHKMYCRVTAANAAGATAAISNTVLVPFPGRPAPKAEGNPVISVYPSSEVDPASSFAEPFPSGPSGKFSLVCSKSRFVPASHVIYSWELQFYRSVPAVPGAPSSRAFAPEDTITGSTEAQDRLTLTVAAGAEGPEPMLNGRPLKLPVTPWSREFSVRCASKGTAIGGHNSTTVQSPVLYLISETPLATELTAPAKF